MVARSSLWAKFWDLRDKSQETADKADEWGFCSFRQFCRFLDHLEEEYGFDYVDAVMEKHGNRDASGQ